MTSVPASLIEGRPSPVTQTSHNRYAPHTSNSFCRLLHRLDVCWTLLYFIFLLAVGVTTTTITQTLITRQVVESWHTIHDLRVHAVLQRIDSSNGYLWDMARAFQSMHLQRQLPVESEHTLSLLCASLDKFDDTVFYRSFSLASLVNGTVAACLHGLPSTGDPWTLSGYFTSNHINNGTYLIDKRTYTFVRPRVQLTSWANTGNNASVFLPEIYGNQPIFPVAEAYYYNYSIKTIPPEMFWTYPVTTPHLLLYNLPYGYTARGIALPAGQYPTDFVQVRLDGSLLLINYNVVLSRHFSSAALVAASLQDADPRIFSNNWGQSSVNNTSVYSPVVDVAVSYLHVSNISDSLMREALRHVKLGSLQQDGYNHSVDFQFHGALATLTACFVKLPHGLQVPFVFVSAQSEVTQPYRRLMNITNGIMAVALVVLTVFFWFFIHSVFTQPLEHMTELLQHSLQPGSRALFYEREHPCWHVQLTEVRDLIAVQNDAMRRLRAIDAFIPVGLRDQLWNREAMSSGSRDPRERQSLSVTSLSTRPTDPTLAVPFSVNPQTTPVTGERVGGGKGHLLQHAAVVVTIRIVARTMKKGTTASSLSPPVGSRGSSAKHGQLLAAAIEHTTRTCPSVNTGPFPSREVLEDFATAVYAASSQYHGIVHDLNPECGTVHFLKAARAVALRQEKLGGSPAGAGRRKGSRGKPSFSPADGASIPAASSSHATPVPPTHSPQEALTKMREMAAATDARDAAAFALALQLWVDNYQRTEMPDVRLLLDSGSFICGQYRPRDSEQTLSVVLGRDVQREVGHVAATISVRTVMTEAVATQVLQGRPTTSTNAGGMESRDGVRVIPIIALQTGRAGLNADVVVLYEVLPGLSLCDVGWQRYAACCFDAFAKMVDGDYPSALAIYRCVGEIADLEPGLMPSSLHREAAASSVTGGAASTQVQRLMRECVLRVARGDSSPYCRARHVPLGIDAVRRSAAHHRAKRHVPIASFPGPTSPTHSLPRLLSSPTHTAAREPRSEESTSSSDRESPPHPKMDIPRPVGVGTWKAVRRYVITTTVDGQESQHILSDRPCWIRDDLRLYWYLPHRSEGVHVTHPEWWRQPMTALGSAGVLSTVTPHILRQVPPMVIKALADAPDGPLSDELRCRIPICEPPVAVQEKLHRLVVRHQGLRHPNLIRPEGLSFSMEGMVALISEFCPGGSVRRLLLRYPYTKPLTIIRFGLCILSGLSYLHERGIVHGALSPDTVMVGGDGLCRLCGYFYDYPAAHALLALPRSCYLSPAMAAGALPTPPCDMFCYGLLALEALTHKPPWTWASSPSAHPAVVSDSITAEHAQHKKEREAGTSHDSMEALAALLVEDGAAFAAAVCSGRVVPALGLLADASVLDKYTQLSRETVQRCLSYNAEDRPTAAECRIVNKTLLTQCGLVVEEGEGE